MDHDASPTARMTAEDSSRGAPAHTATPRLGAVLIADDEEDIRELLRELLELRGYEVVTARDGQEVLEVLQSEQRLCFVLMDLAMPRLGGLEVLEELELHPALCRVPLWISTATPRLVPVDVPCLPKPLDVQRLFELLADHCVCAAA